VEAKAILLPKVKDNDEDGGIEDMDEEEYEFDILWDSNKQLWVTTVKNGHYLINAKIKGFKEINKYVKIGEREFRFKCKPVNHKVPDLNI
jgi:hypothetical protein